MVFVESGETSSCKRPYDLSKRSAQMGHTKAAALATARAQLETGGMREFSMESLAKATGVTRQTIYNLFGTRSAVLEALFDQIAAEAGMERMREVMTTSDPKVMLERFIAVFSGFWTKNRLLLRRIHGIAAIDPEFGQAVQARNQRRRMAATRVMERLDSKARPKGPDRVGSLVALTSFEFFDALAESLGSAQAAEEQLPGLIRRALAIEG
jgi:AcrR family transcriptional regulator